MNLINEALQLHAHDLADTAGECVTYVRGTDQIEVMAVLGETVIESQDRTGAIIESRTQDFIVQASEIDFGDGPVEPDRKDKVLMDVGGTVVTFELLPELSFPHFRKQTGYAVAYRIHTKEKPS